MTDNFSNGSIKNSKFKEANKLEKECNNKKVKTKIFKMII